MNESIDLLDTDQNYREIKIS